MMASGGLVANVSSAGNTVVTVVRDRSEHASRGFGAGGRIALVRITVRNDGSTISSIDISIATGT